MNDITIELNQQDFAGGEKVVGEVVVQLEQDTPFRGVRLKLEGYEKSSWREGSGKHRHTHSETRNFFKEEITLEGRPRLGLGELVADGIHGFFTKNDYPVLRAGSYRYDFNYTLPPDLPAAYESALTGSRIHYGITAHVDLPLKMDLGTQQALTIREPAEPAAVQPVFDSQTKEFLLDSDSVVEAAIHLAKDTFAPGELLDCQLEVTNRAPRKEIRVVTLALRQIENLRAGGHTHEVSREVCRSKFEDCRFPLKDKVVRPLQLKIPDDLYPTIARSSLIKVEYALELKLDIPWAIDAKLSVPIRLAGDSSAPNAAGE